MREVLVICDRAPFNESAIGDECEVLRINQYSPDDNLRLQINNISHRLLKTLSDRGRDLLDIAAYVYHADSSISRGTDRDVFSESWCRRFKLVIPVREPQIWNRSDVKETLVELLEFLTDDKYEFTFAERAERAEQLVIKEVADAFPYTVDADCVLLFSGGLDSLAGAIHLCDGGRKPVLVSHRSRSTLAGLQQRLAKSVRERFPVWDFPHLDVWINRRGDRAKENTQRSRSFLYFALGALIAYELRLPELLVCENGITSFNLPRFGQPTGAELSRSTHPRVITTMADLVSKVYGKMLTISTPFIWHTRAEELQILKENGSEDLICLSSSCAHARRPKEFPHCGTCSQCVDRRFAIAAANLDHLRDEIRGYEKDIFTEPLEVGEERMQPTSVVQFALALRKRFRESSRFCEEYGQIYSSLEYLDEEPEVALEKAYELFQRFANEVINVMARYTAKNWEQMVNQELPDTSLLVLSRDAGKLPDWKLQERADQLIKQVAECPVGNNQIHEVVCQEVLTFLFCDDVPPARALLEPHVQAETDAGYRRRDLLFENRATTGFWGEIRQQYKADGIIADPKNYQRKIDASVVLDFAKYLQDGGVGKFGLVIARKVPELTRRSGKTHERIPSAVAEQKTQWKEYRKMIILLDDDDLIEMLRLKKVGKDPTDLIRERIFTLKSRF